MYSITLKNGWNFNTSDYVISPGFLSVIAPSYWDFDEILQMIEPRYFSSVEVVSEGFKIAVSLSNIQAVKFIG